MQFDVVLWRSWIDGYYCRGGVRRTDNRTLTPAGVDRTLAVLHAACAESTVTPTR